MITKDHLQEWELGYDISSYPTPTIKFTIYYHSSLFPNLKLQSETTEHRSIDMLMFIDSLEYVL